MPRHNTRQNDEITRLTQSIERLNREKAALEKTIASLERTIASNEGEVNMFIRAAQRHSQRETHLLCGIGLALSARTISECHGILAHHITPRECLELQHLTRPA